MKYDVLFNFISPVTGRLCIPEDYILIGDGQGFSTPSPILIDMRLDIANLRRDVNDVFDTSFIIGFPDVDFPNAQVLSELNDGFIYNTGGTVSTFSIIPITSLPNLSNHKIWIGNSSNRPVEAQTIIIDNLPSLSSKKIWRGNISNRPVEVDDLSAVEEDMSGALSDIANLFSLVSSLQSLVNGLESAINIIGGIAGFLALQTQVAGLVIGVAVLESKVNGLTINLAGDVSGSGSIYDPVITTLNLTLDQIKIAQNTVNLNNHKISNLKSDQVEQQDALNAKFLWDLMHDQVEVIWA